MMYIQSQNGDSTEENRAQQLDNTVADILITIIMTQAWHIWATLSYIVIVS